MQIQKLRQARQERTQITQDKVLRELAVIAFSNMSEVATWGPDGLQLLASVEISAEATAAIASVNCSPEKASIFKSVYLQVETMPACYKLQRWHVAQAKG